MHFPAAKNVRLLLALVAVMAAVAPATPAPKTRDLPACSTAPGGAAPLIIGHRGAPGYLPENTLAGYELAIELGADYIEADLVSTRDGALIARHEPNLLYTTDVSRHREFAARRRIMEINGVSEEGYFASDFTLAEISTLRAVQVVAQPDHSPRAQYRIPTLEEILQVLQRQSERSGRRIGLYVEAKHASWHRALGLPLEDKLLAALERTGYGRADAPVFIESFESASLKYLHGRSPLPMIQLIGGAHPDDSHASADMLTPQGLREVARYAAGIGVSKSSLLPSSCPFWNPGCDDAQRRVLAATQVVSDAHAAGLLVHPFTFKSDPYRLAHNYRGNPAREYQAFYALGVDGVITDNPDAALLARGSCLPPQHLVSAAKPVLPTGG